MALVNPAFLKNVTIQNHRNSQQVSLQESARVRIKKRLQEKLHRPIDVIITDNRHTMISIKNLKGRCKARVHHMFLDAPDGVLSALGRFFAHRDPLASRLLDDFIHARKHLIRKKPLRRISLRTKGQYFDLSKIFADLNQRFFAKSVKAEITWGRRVSSGRSRKRRKTIKLGSYLIEERLIRIHPSLDRDFVPSYFVEWIVYHEMLHQVVPVPIRGGRRCFHSDEFRAREQLFPAYQEASQWERENLIRLLNF